jgi:hypothetical protein
MPVRAAATNATCTGQEAPGDESGYRRQGVVEPPGVVYRTDRRLLLGDLGEQGRGG